MIIKTYTGSFKCIIAPILLDLEQNQISPGDNHSSSHNFDSLRQGCLFVCFSNMIGKADPTISYSYLVAESSILAGP